MRAILTVVLSFVALGASPAGYAQFVAMPGDELLAPLPFQGNGPVNGAVPGLNFPIPRRESPPFLKVESNDVLLSAMTLVAAIAIQSRISGPSDTLGFTAPTLALKDPLNSSRTWGAGQPR